MISPAELLLNLEPSLEIATNNLISTEYFQRNNPVLVWGLNRFRP